MFFAELIYFTVPLNASPIFLMLRESEKDLSKTIQKCLTQTLDSTQITYYPLSQEKDYKNFADKMIESARAGSKSRIDSLNCLNSFSFNEEEKNKILQSIDMGFEIQKDFLEIYRRWLYSFAQDNLITPIDEKEIDKFYEAKYDLYLLLHNKTKEWIFQNIDNKEESVSSQFYYLYISLFKLHNEFYNAISEDYRNSIIKKFQ
ncbi:MAG: hypothetical protein L6Q54_14420 [Leptospiraceae bacterium]|nr:hypothetical protein [Leptospiraceae bacterium]MCK6382427.1 hypothetical protein [Leptospiraceae bacterium]